MWWPGSGFLNFVDGLVTFVVLGVLHALDAAASIELSSEEFICLHESVELYCQVWVLCLEHLSVSFKSILLMKTVFLLPRVLVIDDSLALDIFPRHVQLLLKCLQVNLRVSNFVLQITVVSFSRPQLTVQVVTVTWNFISVTFECVVLLISLVVAITVPHYFPLGVLETMGLHVKVMGLLLDQAGQLLNTMVNSGDLVL